MSPIAELTDLAKVETQSLKRQFRRLRRTRSTLQLWLACVDSGLDPVFERVAASETALVLRRRPDQIVNDDDRAIDYAVSELGVAELVVCGHSHCNFSAQATPAAWDPGRSAGYADMVERVRRAKRRDQQLQERVLLQVAALRSGGITSRWVSEGYLEVHGAFYFAESGILAKYDPLAEQFVAQLETSYG